ncbi:MAG: 4Fe-4S binding protein [Myxococcota bacterium]|jgi:ferredoxin|nr:4Fe-4S binding protein [Myxococcota bacterium]
MAIPKVNKDECTSCEACVDECPAEAISMVDGLAVIDNDACTECGACIDACPAEAIKE